MSVNTTLIKRDKSELDNYIVSQNEIGQKSDVFKSLNVPVDDYWQIDYDKSYPYILLPFTDNLDDAKRNKLLNEDSGAYSYWIPESKISININFDRTKENDAYDDDHADEKFLLTPPVNYLVISKPNIGEIEFAEKLAKHTKCVLITPELLLQQEIIAGTKAGKCIEFNLKMGRAIGPDVIIKLATRRIKSDTAKHRGFVIAGFPLIHNKMYTEDPLSSESAIFTAQEIFDELPVGYDFDHSAAPSTKKGSKVTKYEQEEEQIEEERAEEEEKKKKKKKKSILKSSKKEEDIDLGPERPNIVKKVAFDVQSGVETQMEYLFTLLKDPTVYIYIACDNLDVLNKVENIRFSVAAEQEIVVNKENVDIFKPEFFSQLNLVEYEEDSEIDYKTMVKLPVHSARSVSDQLIGFKYHLQTVVDKKALAHDLQHFIRLDGRLTPTKLFNIVRIRLRTLGFHPVLIPEKIGALGETAGEFLGEEIAKTLKMPPEQSFKMLRNKNIVGSMYKWQLSNWGYKCPVALKNGIIEKGTTERAVQFMNKIFFLSTDEALLSFCRNPRPYLLPYKPECPGRFFIFGPKICGKSSVAECLSYAFNCTVLDPKILEEDFRMARREEHLEKIKTAAFTDGILSLMEMREREKQKKIEIWLKTTKIILRTEFPEFAGIGESKMILSDLKVTKSSEITAGVGAGDGTPGGTPTVGGSESPTDISVASSLSERTHSELLAELQYNNLPIDDAEQVKLLLEEPEMLLEYLPEELKQPIDQPTIHDSFVIKYVEDVVDRTSIDDPDLTKEEIIEMFRNALSEVAMENEGRGRWIIDGFPPDIELLKAFSIDELADEVICLRDEDPENIFLLAKYARKEQNPMIQYKNFFENIRRISAAQRAPSIITQSFKTTSSRQLYKSVEDFIKDDIDTVKSDRDEEYADHLTDFNKQWFEIRDYFKGIMLYPPIEINIANKTYPELFIETLLEVEDKFRRTATLVTDDDKVQETRDFGGNMELAGEGGEEGFSYESFLANRRYGDTNIYCPVALQEYYVLWKGKENFSVEFENKLYFLSNEDVMHAFLKDPRKYINNIPVDILPPLRICIIGALGSGKTTNSRILQRNYGLHYFLFEGLLQDYVDLDNTQKLDDVITKPQRNFTNNQLLHVDDIQMIKKYLDGDINLPEEMLKTILTPMWFTSPFKETGFVLDGFPRTVEDVQFMCENYLIPDIVIELSLDEEEAHSRVFKKWIDEWQKDIDERKEIKRRENEAIIAEWEDYIEERTRILFEELKEEKRQEFLMSQPPVPPYSSPVESFTALPEMTEAEEEEVELNMYMYDPEQENEDIELMRLKAIEETPKPVFDDQWETIEEAADRIEVCIRATHTRDFSSLADIKLELQVENIDYTIFDTSKTINEISFELCKFLDRYKYRSASSLIERVYSVTVDVAEKLLEQGYYYLSKFGRTCPVQVYEKKNPLQMFIPSEHKMSLFPLIHRRYIYFICGYEHREKFMKDPLHYLETEEFHLPLLPMKVAIIGPPKCGKSYLAEKFQKEYGLKIITRGQALRYVLKQLPNCELAQNIRKVLHEGWSVTHEMIAGAVEAYTLDAKCMTQGYVLDGLPCTEEEMKHMINVNVVPYVVLNIQAVKSQVKEGALCDYPRNNNIPLYSWKFIKYRYKNWKWEIEQLETFLFKQYQNIYNIPPERNKWCAWKYAKDLTVSNFFSILENFQYIDFDKVALLKSLLVTPYEFDVKQSNFAHYCPCCLWKYNYLVNGGLPPNRDGVVQYRDYYFWICQEHLSAFMTTPYYFLPPHNETALPQILPLVVDEVGPNLYMDGLCIVTFWDNWPRRVFRVGNSDYTVLYDDKWYVFCEEECMKKFLREPHLYFNKVINFRIMYPLEMPRRLPNMGFLEQTCADEVIRAIIFVEIKRPVHPFMSIEMSAAIFMALFLKSINCKNPEFFVFFDEFRKLYNERCEEIKEWIDFFKKNENPFLHVN